MTQGLPTILPLQRSRATTAIFAFVLLALSVVSLALVSTVDDAALRFVSGSVPHGVNPNRFLLLTLWLIRARVTSCAVCAALWVVVNRVVGADRAARQQRWRAPAWVAVGWLSGTVVAVFGFRVYVPPLPQ